MNDKGFRIIDDFGRVVIEQEIREEFDSEVTNKMVKRSVVLIMCQNDVATILLYLRCIRKKIVPVMVSGRINFSELTKMIKEYRPSYIWTDKASAKEIANVVVVGYYEGHFLMEFVDGGQYKVYDDLALLLPTSGSTGSSKLVRISYKNLECNTDAIIKSLNIKENDVAPLVLPISYTYALSIINTYYKVGATIIVTKHKVYMDGFWKLINRVGITSFSGVPYTYEMLTKLRILNNFPDTLKVMTVAGGMLDSYYLENVYEYSQSKSIKFFVMYGQTEATARISVMEMDGNRLQGGCIGRVLDGLEYRINEDGELIIYGDSVSLGYAISYKDLIQGDDNKGVLNTNDIVRIEDDCLYWLGRKDRCVKIYGNRVDFTQLERKIKDRFIGYECLCKQLRENEITIFTDFIDGEEVLEYVISITELNRLNLDVKVVKEFSRKENGKMDYSRI